STAQKVIPPDLATLARALPLPWSHYVRLLGVQNPHARSFSETEAVRGGWSVRQLDRQVSTQFYERTALSKDKAAMLTKGQQPRPEDTVRVEEEIRLVVVDGFREACVPGGRSVGGTGWVAGNAFHLTGSFRERRPRNETHPRMKRISPTS